jgi:hypothetical protein
MKKRPSPSDSATLFKKGSLKRGNDGNIYTITVDKNKIHKWTQTIIVNNDNLYMKGQFISEAIKSQNVQYMTELEYYGELNVQGNLCIGDSIQYELPAFGKGKYYIYTFFDSFIASKKKLTLSKILTTQFSNKININVTVDYGVFVYRDSKTLKVFYSAWKNLIDYIVKNKISKDIKKYKLIQQYIKKNKTNKTSDLMLDEIENYTNRNVNKVSEVDIIKYLKSKFSKDEEEAIKMLFKSNFNDALKTDIVSYYASNYFGDGIFNVICDDKYNIIMQCGLYTHNLIYNLYDVLEKT